MLAYYMPKPYEKELGLILEENKMEYLSGDGVDENLCGFEEQSNDLKVVEIYIKTQVL
ncbi:MAG: hypothetical protein IIX48_12115 [Lachnospiraceae bacterium]|nr:hypothetical protein [Lachnospiraceae bacterium]